MATPPQSKWVRRSGIISAGVVFLAFWLLPIGRGSKAGQISTLVTNSELPAEWRNAFWFSAVLAFFVYGCIAALVGLGVQVVLYLFFRPKRNGWRPGGDCRTIILVSLILALSVGSHAQRAATLRPQRNSTTESLRGVPNLQAEIAKAERIVVGKILSIGRGNASGLGWAKVEVLDVWKGTVSRTNLDVRLPYFEVEDGHDYLLLIGTSARDFGPLAVVEISQWPYLREQTAGKPVEQRVVMALDAQRDHLGVRLARLGVQHAQLTAILEAHTAEQRSDTNSLRVVVVPAQHFARLKEPFKVELRVENRTATSQTVQVMNCSWDEHWKSSNTNVIWEGWNCYKNFAVPVGIAPGRAYVKELKMVVMESPPADPKRPQFKDWISFRMGFTPIGSPKTIWSHEVALKVIP
jgi:hypothetical protein